MTNMTNETVQALAELEGTLARTYLTGQALAGLLSQHDGEDGNPTHWAAGKLDAEGPTEHLASRAVRIADATLAKLGYATSRKPEGGSSSSS